MHKRYRYFKSHSHGYLERVRIVKVPFLNLYILRELRSFRFGYSEDVYYRTVRISNSIFKFKAYLKEEGVIRNEYKLVRNFDTWPEEFKKVFNKHFNSRKL